jgi:hypothetical protein
MEWSSAEVAEVLGLLGFTLARRESHDTYVKKGHPRTVSVAPKQNVDNERHVGRHLAAGWDHERSRSRDTGDRQMKQLAHFLADSANFNQDGTFTVFKGGITEIQAMGFPSMAKFVVVTRLEFTMPEAAKLHQLQLNLTLPDGSHVSGQRQPIAVRVTDVTAPRIYANVIGQLNVGLAQAGELVIAGEVDGQRLPLLFLTVRKVEVV